MVEMDNVLTHPDEESTKYAEADVLPYTPASVALYVLEYVNCSLLPRKKNELALGT